MHSNSRVPLLPETLYWDDHLPRDILFESMWFGKTKPRIMRQLRRAERFRRSDCILSELRAALDEQGTLAKGLVAEHTRMRSPHVF